MEKFKIVFRSLVWETPQEGVEQKLFVSGTQKLRLVRFTDTFHENDWCMHGHFGYVLSGSMKIDFNGRVFNYQEGDGLWIDGGEQSKHKVYIEKGRQVELILFE